MGAKKKTKTNKPGNAADDAKQTTNVDGDDVPDKTVEDAKEEEKQAEEEETLPQQVQETKPAQESVIKEEAKS
jgi:hypothetical protein